MLKIFTDQDRQEDNNDNYSDSPEWIDSERDTEGQLAVDVYQTEKNIIIQSTIAGVKPEDLNISLYHDLITIKGRRQPNQKIADSQYLYKECYWGPFSRSIILPSEVDNKKIEAILENGILSISLTKTKANSIKIKVKE